MSGLRVWQFRLSRGAGRLITRIAAWLTLGKMPPFVSTSAIVRRGHRILVVVDAVRNEPVLPGGHLRWSEDPRQAVVREVREETGCDIDPVRILGVFSGREWAGEEGVVRVVYEAEVRGGALRSSAEGEACWMPAGEIARSPTRDAALVRIWLEGQNAG